jgi:hypothetical protein
MDTECLNSGLSNGCQGTDDTWWNMQAQAQLAVEGTNVVFLNSDINARLNLATRVS